MPKRLAEKKWSVCVCVMKYENCGGWSFGSISACRPCPLWVIASVRGLQNQASGGKERIGHLELVAPLVVVQLPPAPRHDHEHLLLGEGRQGPIEEDLELGGDGMAALEDGSRHLVH